MIRGHRKLQSVREAAYLSPCCVPVTCTCASHLETTLMCSIHGQKQSICRLYSEPLKPFLLSEVTIKGVSNLRQDSSTFNQLTSVAPLLMDYPLDKDGKCFWVHRVRLGGFDCAQFYYFVADFVTLVANEAKEPTAAFT